MNTSMAKEQNNVLITVKFQHLELCKWMKIPGIPKIDLIFPVKMVK